jgi:hypothetical protein
MKKFLTSKVLAAVCLVFIVFSSLLLTAQEYCEVSLASDEGYTSTISSFLDNGDDRFTMTIRVDDDGCLGCKAINHYSIQVNQKPIQMFQFKA